MLIRCTILLTLLLGTALHAQPQPLKLQPLGPDRATWLWPDPRHASDEHWRSTVVPDRFYFRKADQLIATDRDGKVLWQCKLDGQPLFDYGFDLRALYRQENGGIIVEWISPKTGQSTLKMRIDTPPEFWALHLLLGRKDGDIAAIWEDGIMPPREFPPDWVPDAPIRFYVAGKFASELDRRKIVDLAAGPIGRDRHGNYLVRARDNPRQLVQIRAEGTIADRIDFLPPPARPPMFAGDLDREPLAVRRQWPKLPPEALAALNTAHGDLKDAGPVFDDFAHYLTFHRSGTWHLARLNLRTGKLLDAHQINQLSYILGPANNDLYIVTPAPRGGAADNIASGSHTHGRGGGAAGPHCPPPPPPPPPPATDEPHPRTARPHQSRAREEATLPTPPLAPPPVLPPASRLPPTPANNPPGAPALPPLPANGNLSARAVPDLCSEPRGGLTRSITMKSFLYATLMGLATLAIGGCDFNDAGEDEGLIEDNGGVIEENGGMIEDEGGPFQEDEGVIDREEGLLE